MLRGCGALPGARHEEENTMLRRTLVLGVSVALAATAALTAQDRKPLSPAGTASAMVGGTWSAPDKDGNRKYDGGKWLEVTYSRPMLRGRTDIFGKGADYGKMVSDGEKIWRVGANATTKWKTEVPLMIGGKRIEPGSYAVFVELKEPAWTFILSTQPTQEKYDPEDKTKIWGSYGYDPKFDVVRVPMTMLQPKASIEQFTIGFIDMTNDGGKLALAWEKTAGIVPFTVAK
jgi:hypothetical protein